MTSLLFALAYAGVCDVPTPCGTGHAFEIGNSPVLSERCGLPLRRTIENLPPPRRGLDKLERDSFGTFPNEVRSENFIIKWGINGGVAQSAAQDLSDALEASWDVYIDDWGYTPPPGADTYVMNIYIGSTGSNTPDDLGAGGYYWTDDDGYPMIVVAKPSLQDSEYLLTVAAHEFFHAIQASNGDFAYDDISGWWWEATAMWVEHEVFPDNAQWPIFLYWFAIRPELSVAHFEYPTTGSPEQYHQYGAFVYVTHLTEEYGGPEFVQETFRRSFTGGTPMEVIEELLLEEDANIASDFAHFTRRNANWDYPTSDWFLDWIEVYGGYSERESHRISGTIVRETEGWVEPDEYAPHTFGANYWQLRDLGAASEIRFEGDLEVDWHVSLVSQTGSTHDAWPISLIGGAGTVSIPNTSDLDNSWLVITATGDLIDDGTEFSYRLSVTALTDDWEEEDGPKACGCSTTPTGFFPWLLLPLLAFARRR